MSNMVNNEEVRPEMDDLLHNYFKAELPNPWPAFQAPLPMRTKRPVSFWSRYSGRIALAACIALLAAGYLSLAGYFPRLQTVGIQEGGPHLHLGQKEKGNKIVVPNLDSDDPMPMPMPVPMPGSK